MKTHLKTVIADNVRALLGLHKGEKGLAKLIKLGVANGNAQRVLGGETSVGADLIEEVAAALSKLHRRIEPWQLCVPGLDPQHLPVLGAAAPAWPLRQIDAEVLAALDPRSASAVENSLLALLAVLNIPPRSAPPPLPAEPEFDSEQQDVARLYARISNAANRNALRAVMEQFAETDGAVLLEVWELKHPCPDGGRAGYRTRCSRRSHWSRQRPRPLGPRARGRRLNAMLEPRSGRVEERLPTRRSARWCASP